MIGSIDFNPIYRMKSPFFISNFWCSRSAGLPGRIKAVLDDSSPLKSTATSMPGDGGVLGI
jgi:hypothetical protein